MKKAIILDTNILIDHFMRRYTRPRKKQLVKDAEHWAKELIRVQATNAIVTPVYVEVICGIQDEHEARLRRAFLDQFHRVDEHLIPPQDWQNAIRIAGRVSATSRDFGDCLIRAIADRLGYEVRTNDKDFPT